MVDINQVYQSEGGDYLKAVDFGEFEEREYTIEGTKVESFKTKDGEEYKVVAKLSGGAALVLNKTNSKKIAYAHGSDTDGWQGVRIIVYRDTTEFQGSTVPCLRVRHPAGTVTQGDRLAQAVNDGKPGTPVPQVDAQAYVNKQLNADHEARANNTQSDHGPNDDLPF